MWIEKNQWGSETCLRKRYKIATDGNLERGTLNGEIIIIIIIGLQTQSTLGALTLI
jgi:hypothetical protein